MKHRKLRIAWSVAWGLAAVLLVALWMRSYWWMDAVTMPITASRKVEAFSGMGRVEFRVMPWGRPNDTLNPWYLEHFSRAQMNERKRLLTQSGQYQPETRYFGPSQRGFLLPHTFLSFVLALTAVVPWMRRFSLRTLLIATTLVAAGLGLAIWAAR